MTPQGKNTLVCTIIPMCKQKSEEMTHGHAELEPQVISANPTVRAGTLNAYLRGWPLRNGHSMVPMIVESYIRCRKSQG